MMWKVYLSKSAEKFLEEGMVSKGDVFDLVTKAIKVFQGTKINLDIKKLKGEWRGFYRIRKGDARIITSFNFDDCIARVEIIDWRGGVY